MSIGTDVHEDSGGKRRSLCRRRGKRSGISVPASPSREGKSVYSLKPSSKRRHYGEEIVHARKGEENMEFKGPLLVVEDMEQSKAFYGEILGLRVVMDFGANVTLTGGVFLQTKDTWKGFLNASAGEIAFGGKDGELYFEEDDFDAFIDRIRGIDGIRYVHPVKEHQWGQRVVRLYDPDSHVIEVGENMQAVCRRFLDSGLTAEETAARMGVPIEFVNGCMR